jgi:hypothetical protein
VYYNSILKAKQRRELSNNGNRGGGGGGGGSSSNISSRVIITERSNQKIITPDLYLGDLGLEYEPGYRLTGIVHGFPHCPPEIAGIMP